jgi:RES domain
LSTRAAQAPFDPAWFERGVRSRAAPLWRGVEAQHIVASMRLVDSAAEQQVLEELLETSKPALPAGAEGQHYLLATPFRYRPRHESRFRPAGSAGLWYGAEELETACAEVAYWKWRFLTDSAVLATQALHTQHTFFQAQVSGRCVDLMAAPWSKSAAAWTHKTDYRACQHLAGAAREHAVAWVRYASARNRPGRCGAVLVPAALSLKPGFVQQTWACKTSRETVYLRHDDGVYSFEAADW